MCVGGVVPGGGGTLTLPVWVPTAKLQPPFSLAKDRPWFCHFQIHSPPSSWVSKNNLFERLVMNIISKSLFWEVLITNLNAYNCYLIHNIGCKASGSSPIAQYDKRTALLFSQSGVRTATTLKRSDYSRYPFPLWVPPPPFGVLGLVWGRSQRSERYWDWSTRCVRWNDAQRQRNPHFSPSLVTNMTSLNVS